MAKIEQRAGTINQALVAAFPELITVTDEAVNCRDHYVHGGKPRLDYARSSDTVDFFIDTLEFVFGASDLIEGGWDAKAWAERGTTMSHPFGRFRVTYKDRLKKLKALLPP